MFNNKDCGKVFATFLGNILFGGLSAVIFWGIYGPLTAYPVIGSTIPEFLNGSCYLSLGDLIGSLLVGFGGPTFLLTEARRRCDESSTEKKKQKN